MNYTRFAYERFQQYDVLLYINENNNLAGRHRHQNRFVISVIIRKISISICSRLCLHGVLIKNEQV